MDEQIPFCSNVKNVNNMPHRSGICSKINTRLKLLSVSDDFKTD